MKTLLYALRIIQKTSLCLKYAYALSRLLSTRMGCNPIFEDSILLIWKNLMISLVWKGINLNYHRSKLELFCSKHLGSKWDNPTITMESGYRTNPVYKGDLFPKAEDWHPDDCVRTKRSEGSLDGINFSQYHQRSSLKGPHVQYWPIPARRGPHLIFRTISLCHRILRGKIIHCPSIKTNRKFQAFIG